MPAERSSATKRARNAHNESSDPCEICGQVVSRNSDMPRHMKTHDTSEKIPCPFEACDFRTVQKSNLETHMRRHNKEKIFPCNDDTDCFFSTCDAASLLRHRKKMHNYVPRPTASKKKAVLEPRPKGQTSRRNPHRIPVSVLRSVEDESDTPTQTLSQFSSFPSGAPPASASASTPIDSLCDLSDLSDLTDSEVESDSIPSTPSASLSPPSAAPASCSLPPVDSNIQPAVFFVKTPDLYLSQDIVGDISFYSTVKPAEQITSAQLQWLWGVDSTVEAECETFMYPESSYSSIQPYIISNKYDPEYHPSYVHQASPGYLATGFNGSTVYSGSSNPPSCYPYSSTDTILSPMPLPQLQFESEIPEPVSAYPLQDSELTLDIGAFQYSPNSAFVKHEPAALAPLNFDSNLDNVFSQAVAYNSVAESNLEISNPGVEVAFDLTMELDGSFPDWLRALDNASAQELVW